MLLQTRPRLDELRISGTKEADVRSGLSALHLAMLGDDWGLQAAADRIRRNPRSENLDFILVRNAKLIPLIGDLLFKNEVYYETEDLGVPPTQSMIAGGILSTLQHAPQFQAEIREWVRELHEARVKPGVNIVEILRDWYQDNESKLRDGDFLNVRPGRRPQALVDAANTPPAGVSSLPPAVDTKQSSDATPARSGDAETTVWFEAAVTTITMISLGWLLIAWRKRSNEPKI